MPGRGSAHDQVRVVIAGGGFAALEAALAIRALLGDRARLTLVSPDQLFPYRPSATAEPFSDEPPHSYDLRAIVDDLGGFYYKARLESVASQQHWVRLSCGVRLEYDALLLALGTRAIASIPGAVTFRDQRDVNLLKIVLDELESERVDRLVFAAPAGISWPLPLYELAFLSAERARCLDLDCEISLVSPEREPLAVFGEKGSQLVAELLADRGVRYVGGVTATGVRRDGALTLQAEGSIKADRVVTVPQLRGRRLSGIPASWWGFVPTDQHGRVEGLSDVYAAGDMTTFPIKQGGLAAQQADRAAEGIAASFGAVSESHVEGHVLRARLFGGEHPLLLRTELDAAGLPLSSALEYAELDHTRSATKVFGRYLTPYLAGLLPRREAPLVA